MIKTKSTAQSSFSNPSFGRSSAIALLAASALTTAFLSPTTSAAPLTADNTSIGAHPSYGAAYSAFWRNGKDYSVITDGFHTYLNAPALGGALIFRGGNGAAIGVFAPDGGPSRGYIDTNSNLVVAGSILGGQGNPAGTGVQGLSTSGVGVLGNSSSNVGVKGLSTSGVGILGSSSSNAGVSGFSDSREGLRGFSQNGTGTFGQSANQVGGWFVGRTFGLRVEGTLNGALILGSVEISNSPGGSPGNLRALGNGYFGGSLQVISDAFLNNNLTVSGKAFKTGSTWDVLSDERVKKDIVDFKPGLSDLEKIHVVKFKYNGLGGTKDTGKEYVGVVAQELEKVAPFMVSTVQAKLHTEDAAATELKEVDPNAFIYMLINSAKELAACDVEQGKKLAALEAQNQRIIAQNAQLVEQNAKLVELADHNKKLLTLLEQKAGVSALALAK